MRYEQAERLLEAHRVLSEQGHDELHFGHLSAIDRVAGVMWMKRGDHAFRGTTEDDLVAVDFAGNRVHGTGPLHTETWLHLGIYAARTDVNAISHSHAPHLVAYSAVQPVWTVIDQYSLEVSVGMCWYDRSGLIVTPELGDALAGALGDGRTCILRSHGVVVADRSIEAAVVGTVQLGRAVDIQLAARTLGGVRPMPGDDVEPMRERFVARRDNRVKNMWGTLVAEGRS